MSDLDISRFGANSPNTQVADPIMHLGANSLAAVRHEIRKQERIHWTAGLRQAELIVRDKLDALHQSEVQARKCSRNLRLLKHEYDELNARRDALTFKEEIRIEEIEDEVVAAKRDWFNIQPLLRDANMEMEAAAQERDRIVKDHPECKDLSFQELQELYGQPALMNKLASFFAAEAWASMNHLPSSVGHLVLDTAPENREMLMRLEAEIRTHVCLDETTVQAARRIASLPPEEQEKVINLLMPPKN